MATKQPHNSVRRASAVALLTALSLPLAGCDAIEQDDFVSQGGISPDPTAIIDGSILYIGPRPTCLYESNGQVERIVGNVVLTMFAYNNPPPPEGSASSALNLYVVSGDEVFDKSDCLPPGAAPVYSERITRSIAFRWPRLELFSGRSADYQIRGFFDYDEDMIPLFSVTRLPTQGDIAGAAVNDIQDASKGFLKITLPSIEQAPDGIVKPGVTIALGNPVWTERPAFRLDENRKLAANAPFSPVIDLAVLAADGVKSLREFRALTCTTPGGDGVSCGLTLQRLGTADETKMAAVGIDVQVENTSRYAFFAEPVDILTVNKKPEGSTEPSAGIDSAAPDGKADPHPFLGSGLGIPWYSPMVIMQRVVTDPVAAANELAARIPRVLLVGSVLLGDDKKPTKNSYVQTGVPVAIPPVAAVELIPGRNDCRVPYFPPLTPSVVTAGRLGHCAELPTGRYSVNVLAGIAGGVPGPAADPLLSESPIAITGGRYGGQSWSIPNELGDATQVPATSLMPDQGQAGMFVIHDPTPGMKESCGETTFKGVCAAGREVSENAEGVDSTLCIIDECCAYVRHLCGIRVCDPVVTPDGNIHGSPAAPTTVAPNGGGVPNCVPFELPPQCCAAP